MTIINTVINGINEDGEWPYLGLLRIYDEEIENIDELNAKNVGNELEEEINEKEIFGTLR